MRHDPSSQRKELRIESFMRELLVVEIPYVVSFAYSRHCDKGGAWKTKTNISVQFQAEVDGQVHWVEFWLHAGCRLGLLGLLGMLLLLVPCAPLVAWIHFGSILAVKWLPRGWILRVLG